MTDNNGAYRLTLPIGTYTIRASAGGCTEPGVAEGVKLVRHNIVLDFTLARKIDQFGHGCRPIIYDWVNATNQTALFGDDFAGRLRLPFSFKFYGQRYDNVFLSDNGYLNFLGADRATRSRWRSPQRPIPMRRSMRSGTTCPSTTTAPSSTRRWGRQAIARSSWNSPTSRVRGSATPV